MTPIGIQLNLSGDRQVEQGLLRVRGAMDNVGSAASGMGRALGGIAGAFAGVLSVREFIQAADAVTSLQNQLKLATGSASQAAQAYGALFDIAQRSRVSFTELGGTFASIARATGELGISQQRLLTVTEAIGNAVTISGTGAQAANAALVQLGQGLASGTLRGEELNSVMEQTPRLAKALADGLGITTGELRKLGSEGAITAEKVIKALESQSGALQGEVKDATLTVGQAFTQLQNSATRAVGDLDKATGASQSLASAISGLAGAVGTVGDAVRNNEGAFATLAAGVGGAAAVAGAVGLASALVRVGTAAAALGAVLAANPAVLALLGVGAAAGAGVAALRASTQTASGIQRAIESLRQENERSEAAYARAVAGGREAGAANILRVIQQRKDEMLKLQAELDGLGGPVGGGRGTVNPETVGAMNARNAAKEAEMLAIRQKLYGVDKDYLPTLEKLHKQYQDGSVTLAEYQGLVGKLADANHKKDKGGADGLKAEQSAYESLMTTINEKIGTVQAELLQNDKLTASQKISIDMEAGLLSGKLKLSSARKAELEGRLEDLRTLEEESAARQRLVQSFDAMEAAQAKALADRDALRGQVYDAEQEAKQIGLVGAALGELTKARMEDAAAALEWRANTHQAMRDDTTAQALREQAQAMRDLYRVQGNNEAARGVAAYAGAIRESSEALDYELSLMGMAERARATALEQYRIEIELRKQIQQIEANTAADPERRAQLVAEATAAAAIAKANASSKVFLEEWKQSVQQYDDIFRQGFADMLNNGKDGWKSFTRSLVTTFKTTVADQIYKMFAQPFVVNIVGNLMGITGGGAGGAALQMASGGGRGLGSLLNLGSSVAGNWGAISGLFSGTMGIANAAGSIAANSIAATGITDGISALLATNGAYGTAAAGGAVAGGGGIAGALSAIPGWGWAAAGALALLGGTGAFSRKHEQRNLQGTFGGDSGFEGRWEDYYKGGLMRRSKSVYTPLDEETRSGLGGQFVAMRSATVAMAETLGLGTAAISNFTASVNIKLKGLSAEDAQKKIQEEFDKIAESLAGTALGTDRYTRVGETSVQTLTRLATSLTGVNTAFENLGVTLYEASLAGGDMASQLVDLFGGLAQFSQATGIYMQNFYSAEEQRDVVRRQLERAFEGLDLKLPDIDASDAREQFRAIAEAQDLTTEAGRRTWAALMGLAGVFASVTEASESAADAAARLAEEQARVRDDAIDKAYRNLQAATDRQLKAIDAQRDALSAQRDSYAESLSLITGIFDIVRSNARELYGEVADTAGMQAAQGMEFVRNALTVARSTGVLPEQDALNEAIQAARNGISQGGYASQFDADFARLSLAGQLSELGDISGRQKTFEEKQLAALDAQSKALDAQYKAMQDQLNYWEEQIAILRGTAVATWDIGEAVRNLSAAILAAKAPAIPATPEAIPMPKPVPEPVPIPMPKPVLVEEPALVPVPVQQTYSRDDLTARQILNVSGYGEFGPDYYGSLASWLKKRGISTDQAAYVLGMTRAELLERFASVGIPAFAAGGMHTGGLRVVGERGWELEATGPARIWNQQQLGQALGGGNAELIAELRALREEVAQLKAINAAMASNTAGLPQMVDQFDNVTEGGNAIRSEAIA